MHIIKKIDNQIQIGFSSNDDKFEHENDYDEIKFDCSRFHVQIKKNSSVDYLLQWWIV